MATFCPCLWPARSAPLAPIPLSWVQLYQEPVPTVWLAPIPLPWVQLYLQPVPTVWLALTTLTQGLPFACPVLLAPTLVGLQQVQEPPCCSLHSVLQIKPSPTGCAVA